MAETTGAAETQAVEATQPQAGTDSPSPAEGAQTAQAASAAAESGTDSSPMSADEAKKLRSEANSLRKRLAEFERQQAEIEAAKLSEVEKAQRKVADLERQIAEAKVREQEREVRLNAVETATRLGFKDPELAYKVLDRASIEFDDHGVPKNVEKLLKAELERYDYLRKGATGDFGGGQRGASPTSPPAMNELLRAAARHT